MTTFLVSFFLENRIEKAIALLLPAYYLLLEVEKVFLII